jgi:CRP-like cAMP-binding protein
MCCLNHTSRLEDVERVLDFFARAPVPPRSVRPRPPARLQTGIEAGWLEHPPIEPAHLRGIPLFASLGTDDLRRVASWARERHVSRGEVATRRWDADRDFCVVLDGTAVVERDGERLAELGPGDFFGEVAALDWGAGHGHARSATVTATAPLRLLVLSPTSFDQLLRLDADLRERIESAVRRQLAGT